MVPDDTDLLATLAAIGQDVKNENWSGKRTRNKILAAAETFGPVNREDNSLTGWARTALEVYANLEAMWTLQVAVVDSDGMSGFREYLESESKAWHVKLERLWRQDARLAAMVEPEGRGRWVWPWEYMLAFLEPHDSPREFRQKMQRAKMDAFGGSVTLGRVVFMADGSLALNVPVSAWASQLLGRAWAGGQPLRPCEGCGRAFVPSRKKRKHCHPTMPKARPEARRAKADSC